MAIGESNTRLFNNRDHFSESMKQQKTDYENALQRQKGSYENRIGKINTNNNEDRSELVDDYEVKIKKLNTNQADELRDLKRENLQKSQLAENRHRQQLSNLKTAHRTQEESNRKEYDDLISRREKQLNTKIEDNHKSYENEFTNLKNAQELKEDSLKRDMNSSLYKAHNENNLKLQDANRKYTSSLLRHDEESTKQADELRQEAIRNKMNSMNDGSGERERLIAGTQHKIAQSEIKADEELVRLTAINNKRSTDMQETFAREKRDVVEHTKEQMKTFTERVKGDFSRKYDKVTENYDKSLKQKELENDSLRRSFSNKVSDMQRKTVEEINRINVANDRKMDLERKNMEERVKAKEHLNEQRIVDLNEMHRDEMVKVKTFNEKRLAETVRSYEDKLTTMKADHVAENQRIQLASDTRFKNYENFKNSEMSDLIESYEDRLENLRARLSEEAARPRA